jgi:hypothetical protein
MKFQKNDIIIPAERIYPDGALAVDGYEENGTLLAHPVGGGFQYRFKPDAEKKFRLVSLEEQNTAIWKRAEFSLEGEDESFAGWTDGEFWNGWAMPYFEFATAEKVVASLLGANGRYDAQSDSFVTQGQDEEIWPAQNITLVGGQTIKVYGIGAGSWTWDEI